MFKSLKSWLNLDAAVKPFVSNSGTGAKIVGTSVPIKCYAEGKVQVVKNTYGKEVVSNKQLYIDGSVAIGELDLITFEGADHEIQAIGYFYKNGKVDLKVVYL